MDSELAYNLHCKINRWIHGGRNARHRRRIQLAAQYLRGNGLEIGALQSPLYLSEQARVRYVDKLSVPELRRLYKGLQSKKLVDVDIVDDGETLKSVEDNYVDFLIANHLLEHCENPIGALNNWLRVIKKGGLVYIAIPDKRFTFDHRRPVTSMDHLLRDWREGPEWSRLQHYEEWMEVVVNAPTAEVKKRASELASTDYSIHFHVWTPRSMKRFLGHCMKLLNRSFRILEFTRNGSEIIVILKHT